MNEMCYEFRAVIIRFSKWFFFFILWTLILPNEKKCKLHVCHRGSLMHVKLNLQKSKGTRGENVTLCIVHSSIVVHQRWEIVWPRFTSPIYINYERRTRETKLSKGERLHACAKIFGQWARAVVESYPREIFCTKLPEFSLMYAKNMTARVVFVASQWTANFFLQ